MASAVGMTIRASKANERIDAALTTLAAGSDVPPMPDRPRDPMHANVVRLEWIADTLETLSGTGAQDEAEAESVEAEPATEAPKAVARKPRKANA